MKRNRIASLYCLIFIALTFGGSSCKRTVNYDNLNGITFYSDSTFKYEKIGLGNFYTYSGGKWNFAHKNLILNSNLKSLHLNASRSDKDYAQNNTARIIKVYVVDNSDLNNYYSYLYDQNDSMLVDPIQPYVDSLFNHLLPLDSMIKHRRRVDLPCIFHLKTNKDSVYFGITKDPIYSNDFKVSTNIIFTNKVSIRNSKDTLHVKINIVDSLFNYQVFNDSTRHVSKFKLKRLIKSRHAAPANIKLQKKVSH